MILHDYWRSSAAYRVRIGLNLKGVAYDLAGHDLRTGEQRAPAYLAKVPHGLVPALELDDGAVLTQSLAILEWLDETHPEPPFLPADPLDRATARAMALTVAADIHPINNLRVLKALKADFGAEQPAIDGWVRHWIATGFATLETMVAQHGGDFCHGDVPGLADILLVPQWYNGERFGLDPGTFPRLAGVVARARALPAFARADPAVQPDAS